MSYRLLIADDHQRVRHLLRKLIEAERSWTVCAEANDGREAVEKALEEKPDLVVLDLAMPRMDGLTAAREIARSFPGIPILIHTVHASKQLSEVAKETGIRQVISKGSGAELLEAIRAHLPTSAQASDSATMAAAASTTASAAAASATAAAPQEIQAKTPLPEPDAVS